MATVYKAYHPSLDRYVAIKVLHQAFLEDPSFLARFQREARVVARLEHPNIVPIYDYAEHEGQPYLVMKFIEGDTLKGRMNRGPLAHGEVTYIVESVGAGLSYAHRQGILHRDIKPSNVIVANDNQIYLADFGLARIAQSGESTLTTDMVLGTPHYISPEQAMAKKDLDEGTDIYSFGVMLYEIVVGKVPFNADTPFSIIHDHIYTPLPLPSQVNPNVSPALERVLLKALAKDRADRYKDVAAMVAAFKEAWMADVPAASMPTAIPMPDATAIASTDSPPPTATPVEPTTGSTPPPAPAAAAGTKKSKRSPWVLAAAAFGICVCCLMAFVLLQGVRKNAANATATTPDVMEATLEHAIESTVENAFGDSEPTAEPTLESETVDLNNITLEQAKQQVDQHPRDARARFIYAFALIDDGQEQAGYEEIKRGINLAGKSQLLLVSAARSYEKQEIWLGAALIYTHLADSLRVMPIGLREDMNRAIYYGFEEPDAPQVLTYETLNQIDHSLSLLAQARYTLINADDDETVRRLLDELNAEKPDLKETQLMLAELNIGANDTEARHILQGLIDSPETSDWIKEEANSLLSEIK